MKHFNLQLTLKFCAVFLCSFAGTMFAQTEISVAPLDCYSGMTFQQMNAAALASHGASPFATWKAAYDYAHTGAGAATVTTINFAPGTYNTKFPDFASWGDGDGGFVLKSGLTVNGNGAMITNDSAGSSQLCFATLASNSIVSNFLFKSFSGVPNGGALFVPSSANNWTVSNCTFDNCNWGTDAMTINMGAGLVGYITGCTFINNGNPGGLYPPASGVGAGSSSALNITGEPTSDLNITNSVFKCNFRNTTGGAVKIDDNVHVDFLGCTFGGNEANTGAGGGAVCIRNNAVVSFTNTVFTCNFTSGGTTYDGGALLITSGSTVTIDGCNFKGNGSPDATWTASADANFGGAIAALGASASIVNLTVRNTIFDGNLALSGAGVYMNDVNALFENNYFTNNNSNGEGGAVYVAMGNKISTYEFNNNTFRSNNANGNCTGIDVFTENHIKGSNNDLEYLADGHHLSNNAGSLQFVNGGITSEFTDIFDYANSAGITNWPNKAGSVTSTGDVLQLLGGTTPNVYTSRPISINGIAYWTANFYSASSFSGGKYMAYVLVANNADPTIATSGYALVQRRVSSTSFPIELRKIPASGIDDFASLILAANLVHTFASPTGVGSSAFKVKFSNNTMDIWYTHASDAGALDDDTRGNSWCTPTVAGLSTSLANGNYYTGTYFYSTSTTSTEIAQFDNIYFRNTDETLGTGWTGTYSSAVCTTCQSTSAVASDCSNQGSIKGTVFRDTEATPDGQQNDPLDIGIDGVVVYLYSATGLKLDSTTTDASGNYFFGGLSNGSYYVAFNAPGSGPYIYNTPENQGATQTDSDFDGIKTQTVTITTNSSSGSNSSSVNAVDGTSGAAHYENVDAGYTNVNTLPVDLLSFSGKKLSENANYLTWKVANESNFKEYQIERTSGIGGENFKQIATVKGEGKNNYAFTDNAINRNNSYYYRLKMVDADNTYSYSKVVKISGKGFGISVAPNPVSGLLNVTFDNAEERPLFIDVVSMKGEVITVPVINGSQVDLSSFASGIYILKYNDYISSRVIKY